MNKAIIWSTLVFFLTQTAYVFAQETLSLTDAITIGLENNYAIKLTKKNKDIAALDNQVGNAGFLPSVAADANYNRTVENTELSFADGTTVNQNNALSTNLNAGIGANWFIFDGTKMFVTKNKLEELEAIADLQVSLNINNSLASIINTYHGIIAEQKTLELYRNQLEVSERRLALSETKLKAGAASELENLQAEVDANADRAAVINQEVRIKQAKTDLNRLLGRSVSTEFNIEDSIRIDQSLEKEALLQKLENNPNLTVLQKEVAVAVLERKENFANRLPTIAINGRYGYNESSSEAGFVRSNQSDGINYGATVSLPIFNGNEKNRIAQQNKIRIEQAKLTYDQQLASLEQNLLANYEQYTANLKQLEFEEKNVILAERNLAFAMENYRLGGISALELREVQFSTLNAQERLVALKYTTKIAEIELLRLTNQLIEGK